MSGSSSFQSLGTTQTTGTNAAFTRNFYFTSDLNPASLAINPWPNTIRTLFPYPQTFKNCEIALVDLFCYYSWFNITSAYDNNTFSYQWPISGGFNTYTVVLPDGFYTFEKLNEEFQQAMVMNGTFLQPTTLTLPVLYYLGFQLDIEHYRLQIVTSRVPSSLPTGYQLPFNYPAGGLPPAPTGLSNMPQLTILPTSFPSARTNTSPGSYSFSKTTGFLPGIYQPDDTLSDPVHHVVNPQATNSGYPQSLNPQFFPQAAIAGQNQPQVETTNNVNVASNMVNQGGLNQYVQVFYSFSPNVGFGSQINETPPLPRFVPVTDGQYYFLDIVLYDENLNALTLQDPHISGTVLIRGR